LHQQPHITFLQSELLYNNYARIPSIRTTLHQHLRKPVLQSELIYINNFALHSFNQNYFTSTSTQASPSIRTNLHKQLRITFLQSELLYINNFALYSSSQKHLIQTASHWVTWFRTALQQQLHFLLKGQTFRSALGHVTLRDRCSRRQEPSDTLVSQSVHSQQSVRTSL